MWSDVFYRAEQLHLIQMLLWAALSIIAGTLLLVIDARARRATLVGRFAWQCVGWGVAELVLGAVLYHGLGLRDVSSATRAERLAWLALGLYLGVAAVGATLALATWRLDRSPAGPRGYRLSGVGVGIGIGVQGLALAVLELLFLSRISR